MKKSNVSVKVSFPAVLGVISLILVYIGSIVPTGNWGLVAVAGLLPAAAVISVNIQSGFYCWAGTSILGFLLIPDKFCVFLYAILFGLYPMIKSLIERLRRWPLELLLKLLFFNIVFTVLYIVMKAAVLSSLPDFMSVIWVLYVVGNIVFLLYDFGFSKLIALYISRVHRTVRRGGK